MLLCYTTSQRMLQPQQDSHGTNTTSHMFLLISASVQGVCTFNDDIQSTAAAVVGAVYGALRLAGVPPLKQQIFLFFGAGQANIGAARLLVSALADEGLAEAQAKQQIWLYDSKARLIARLQAACRATSYSDSNCFCYLLTSADTCATYCCGMANPFRSA